MTVPGITSFQAAISRTNMPLVENKETFTLIPAWTDCSLTHETLEHTDTVVMLKAYKQREEIVQTLKEHGFEGRTMYAARIGIDRELITEDMDEMRSSDQEYLSMLIAKRK